MAKAAHRIRDGLLALADAKVAAGASRFFRQAYSAANDEFLGVRVPQTRAVVKEHADVIDADAVRELLADNRHEVRLAGGIALVSAYKAPKAMPMMFPGLSVDDARDAVVRFYLTHIAFFNNWDFVDLTADKIVGEHLLRVHSAEIQRVCDELEHTSKPEDMEPCLSKHMPAWYGSLLSSTDLWEVRISIVAMLALCRDHVAFVHIVCAWHLLRLNDGLRLSIMKAAFNSNDLIHKALGWVLRQSGKTHRAHLVKFLKHHVKISPKTTVRYATEHFDRSDARRYVDQARADNKRR